MNNEAVQQVMRAIRSASPQEYTDLLDRLADAGMDVNAIVRRAWSLIGD